MFLQVQQDVALGGCCSAIQVECEDQEHDAPGPKEQRPEKRRSVVAHDGSGPYLAMFRIIAFRRSRVMPRRSSSLIALPPPGRDAVPVRGTPCTSRSPVDPRRPPTACAGHPRSGPPGSGEAAAHHQVSAMRKEPDAPPPFEVVTEAAAHGLLLAVTGSSSTTEAIPKPAGNQFSR